jgi:hypothetical protein
VAAPPLHRPRLCRREIAPCADQIW